MLWCGEAAGGHRCECCCGHCGSRKEWNRRPKVLSMSKVPREPIGGSQDKRGSGTKVDITAVNWPKYKRGRVDSIYLDFRYWLEQEVVD